MRVYFWVLLLCFGVGWESRAQEVTAHTRNASSKSTLGNCRQQIHKNCEEYWARHEGRLKSPNGGIYFGYSTKSRLSYVERDYLESLVRSFPRWPEELKVAAHGSLNSLREVLKDERDEDSWYLALQKARQDFEKDFLKVRGPWYGRSRELENRFFQALYEKDPRWKELQTFYGGLLKDYKSFVSTLPLKAEVKERALKKLGELGALEIQDERGKGCGVRSTEAHYDPQVKPPHLVVCTGLFHAMRNTEAWRAVFSHELAHALDPLLEEFQKPLSHHILEEMASGKTMDCEAWRKATQHMLQMPQAAYFSPALQSCLSQVAAHQLPIAPQQLVSLSRSRDPKKFLKSEAITSLCDPDHHPQWYANASVYLEDMRRDLERKQYLNRSSQAPDFLQLPEAYVFSQTLKCRQEKSLAQRCRKAQEESRRLLKGMQRSSEETLKEHHASREYFADWMSARYMKRHYEAQGGATKLPVPRLFEGYAFFCAMPAKYAEHPVKGDIFMNEMSLVGKSSVQRFDPHPPRARRLEDLADSELFAPLLDCSRSDSVFLGKNYYDCAMEGTP